MWLKGLTLSVCVAVLGCGPVEDIAFVQETSPAFELPQAGLLLWLSADQGIENESVGLWRDRSGKRHDATQVDEQARPTRRVTDWTSLPVVGFSLQSSMLLPNWELPSGLSIVAVLRDLEAGFGTSFLVMGTADDHIELGAEGNYFYFEQLSASRSFGPVLLSATADASGHQEFYLGGALASEGDPGAIAGTFAKNHLGPTTTELAELIVYDRALLREEREAIEAYLSAKWTCCRL